MAGEEDDVQHRDWLAICVERCAPAVATIKDLWNAVRKGLERYWKTIQYCFIAISLLLIGGSLYANWTSLSSLEWQLDYGQFAVSLLLVSVAVLSVAVWWTLSIRLLRGRLGWRQGARIWAFAQLAKYLPGGIWNYASRVYASDRAGISKRRTALSLAVETVLRIQAAAIVFLASLPSWPESEWHGVRLLVVVGVLALGFIALNPRVLDRGMNLILRTLGRPAISTGSLAYRHILVLLAGHTLTVVASGAAFYVMVTAVHNVPIQAAFPMTGMLAISVISGFLNPLTPHGLGTREGLLIILLTQYLPVSVAIVIALLSRVWLTLSELVGVLITVLVSGLGPPGADM